MAGAFSYRTQHPPVQCLTAFWLADWQRAHIFSRRRPRTFGSPASDSSDYDPAEVVNTIASWPFTQGRGDRRRRRHDFHAGAPVVPRLGGVCHGPANSQSAVRRCPRQDVIPAEACTGRCSRAWACAALGEERSMDRPEWEGPRWRPSASRRTITPAAVSRLQTVVGVSLLLRFAPPWGICRSANCRRTPQHADSSLQAFWS
jgi:hypothetical protein